MRKFTAIVAISLLAACGGSEPAPAPKAEAPKAEEKKAEEKKEEPKAEEKKDDAPDFAAMSDDEKKAFLMKLGEEVYSSSALACKTCHMDNGMGTKGVFPPLVGEDAKKHMGDCQNHSKIILYGLNGEIEVDGVKYNGVMTPQKDMLNDLQVAAVATYERNSWGNDFGLCLPDAAAAARAAGQ